MRALTAQRVQSEILFLFCLLKVSIVETLNFGKHSLASDERVLR